MATSTFNQPVTLTHHILNEGQKHPKSTGDFSILLHSIEIAIKYISSRVHAAGIFNLLGAEGTINVQGEVVKKLDVVANDAMITCLKRSHKVALMVSEENPEPIFVEGEETAPYAVVFDPLDGSSNIDANVSIGTIFGVYRRHDRHKAPSVEDVLQPGKTLVAAGYAMYGSATNLVLTTNAGVDGFTLDTNAGEFVLTHPNIRIKPRHSIYSVNEGNEKYWAEETKNYVKALKYPDAAAATAGRKSPYSLRYVGSMVADVHRTLLYGGVFMYPAATNALDGKLRLLYEANPMAMLLEHAGGGSSTGTGSILEVVPKNIHQRSPVFLGGRDDIHEMEAFHKKKGEASA